MKMKISSSLVVIVVVFIVVVVVVVVAVAVVNSTKTHLPLSSHGGGIPPWTQNIFSSIRAATGMESKHIFTASHTFTRRENASQSKTK